MEKGLAASTERRVAGCNVGRDRSGRETPGDVDVNIRAGLTDLVLGNGPKAPQYPVVFSRASFSKLFTHYNEHSGVNKAVAQCQVFCSAVALGTQLLRAKIFNIIFRARG